MFRLMMKDIYTQRKEGYAAPVFLLLYFLEMGKELGHSGSPMPLVYSLAVAFIAYIMAIFTNFSTGESDKMQNSLVLSLPLIRRSVIDAKYLMISVWWLFAYISSIILVSILKLVLHESFSPFVDLKILILSLCFTYILSSVSYPVYYKFGYKAAQMFGIILFFAFSFGLGRLLSLNFKSGILSGLFNDPIISCAVITVIIVLISYLLSAYFYEKKEL